MKVNLLYSNACAEISYAGIRISDYSFVVKPASITFVQALTRTDPRDLLLQEGQKWLLEDVHSNQEYANSQLVRAPLRLSQLPLRHRLTTLRQYSLQTPAQSVELGLTRDSFPHLLILAILRELFYDPLVLSCVVRINDSPYSHSNIKGNMLPLRFWKQVLNLPLISRFRRKNLLNGELA